MPYKIAGIDVHKKMLAVVVADVEAEGDFQFERRKVGTSPAELRALAGWLVDRQVDEVVMESTAQYWRPVWEALELHWRRPRRTHDGASPLSGTLHLAQAQSNRGTGGRKRDFPDGETDSSALAALADSRLRATPDQLRNAFGACADLHPVYRRLVKLTLEELRVIEDHLAQLDQQMAELLSHHHDAVHRLAEIPGLGVDSAQQIIAEVGATPRHFPRPSTSPRGWARAPPPRRARARTTVIVVPRATVKCDAS